ncbi:MAG: filamentous hemagglutinin N-terminal domain-containing protein, partial [Verrucomicrobia bacterium]|nr:filamentous hemagglutinin N-terminal domain-containing protein [Verrucomicrobiota bacterium]
MRITCYLLFAICYSGLGLVVEAGDILRGNTGGSNSSPATSSFFGGNQAAMSQLQTNAHDILSRVNQALSSVQAMQQAARNAAGPGNVPNGLTSGGLQIATGKNAEWSGANLPTESVSNGQTTVVIQQTSSQAILNWLTFNIGRNTTVDFNQSAGGTAANTWVALNRILDPSGSPSQILGSIKAQGQVYLINKNGIIFGGASQVNVSTLLASSALITDSQFLNAGIYSVPGIVKGQNQDLPSFTGAVDTIIVEAGAQLDTNAPLGIADRGGSVILMGSAVENAGSITTPDGQTILAAGKDFFLRQGYSITPATGVVTTSTTLGVMIGVDHGGTALNTGIIQTTTGDITMAGGHLTQAGVAISTSSVDQRGTIHLLTATADSQSSVTLAPGSITYIEPDPNSGTALDPQRLSAYALSSSAVAGFPTSVEDYAVLPDRAGISRIEINTGGTVDFAGGSLTSATAGQIEVSAGNRIFTENGAVLDVSGLVNVSLPMSANNLAVNIQGFELRDSSLNRDTASLFNNTIYADLRQLIEVPANSSYNAPYNTQNRYYTAGGLLEVSGELNNVGHSIEEWDTVGGSITLSANQVVAQKGSVFDIAGGSIQYQSGYIKESYVIGSDGRIYNVNTAPSGIAYLGMFNGFIVNHPRWNVTEIYQNVITQPAQIYQPGYIVGRDAGALTIDAPTSIFEGTIDALTYTGPQQDSSRPANITDPFLLTQSTVPLNGALLLGPYTTVVNGTLEPATPFSSNITFGNSSTSLTAGLTATSAIGSNLKNTNTFSAAAVSNADLGGLTVDVQAAAKPSPSASPPPEPTRHGRLTINGPLNFAAGAQISLTAARVFIAGSITAVDGTVTINSISYNLSDTAIQPAAPVAGITLKRGATIDTQGLWTNAFLNLLDVAGKAYVNGGNVTLSSNQGITLAKGSLIDASAGAAILPSKKTVSGTGGNITIEADQIGNVVPQTSDPRQKLTVSQSISRGPLILNGTLRSYGVKAGGALTLQAYSILIGDGIVAGNASQLVLPTSSFDQGFSSYTVHGMESVTVEPGATIDVTEPVYQFSTDSFKFATGTNLTSVFGSPQLMSVYVGNPDTATVTQRPGAGLSLLAGVNGQTPNPPVVAAGGSIEIGNGSTINVDPGQSINVEGAGQITVDGTLKAPSGSIEIVNYRSLGGVYGHGKNLTFDPGGLSVWIGSNATLDVSAQAFVAYDRFGRPYGVVPNAGSIVLGSTGGTETVSTFSNLISTDAFVIIRPGASLNASGTSAVLDLFAGENPVQSDNGTSGSSLQTDRVFVASNGGSISMSSYDGIYIDGTLRAFSGGPGGAGGTLSLTLAGPIYVTPQAALTQKDQAVPDGLRLPRTIVIGQNTLLHDLPADLQPGQDNGLKIGSAYLSANAFEQGGFSNLSLDAANSILFRGNVTLTAAESITLTAISIADTTGHGRVTVSAPYVLFSEPITAVNGYGILIGASPVNFNNTPATSAVTGNGVFSVSADLIDLAYVGFGDSEVLQLVSGTRTFNESAFANVDFVSRGDIRFLPTTSPLNVTSPGNLTFTASELYPVTGAVVTVEAGYLAGGNVQSFVPGTPISVYRVDDAEPAVPQSVFGRLTLEAETINQGGIIRAPLGAVTLGFNGSGFTRRVNFLSGSVTSVSANGLTIPYGGTTDGVTYTVNGQTFNTDSVVGAISDSTRGITLEGVSVSVASDALLDLSGGGRLFGEGFISGRGGSLDILSTALLNQNPSNTFSAANNTVYALIPGTQSYAPPVIDTNTGFTGSMPGIGEQITVPAGVPGLPAGTYTLMPSNYALLPGAFRIELGSRGDTKQPSVLSLVNGSYEVNVNIGIANTGILSALPTEAIITPASAVETYAEYDLETYTSVATSQAQRFNQPRPILPVDASTLTINLGSNQGVSQLSFSGIANFASASGGYSGALVIGGFTGDTKIEITGPNESPTQGWTSLSASAIDAIRAPNIYIGGILAPNANASPSEASTFLVGFEAFSTTGEAITLRTGAVLTGADVFLIAGPGGITVKSGATIDTLNQGAPAFDSTSGYFFTDQVVATTTLEVASVIAVSNGYLNILPSSAKGGGPITVDRGASLFSDGTIAFATSGRLKLAQNVNYGARYIGFSAADINIGTSASFAAAQHAGTLPTGLLLNQTLLDDLLAGDPAVGAPALQILTLSAANSINIYGSVNLNTIDIATGKSTLQDLVFNTPAVYGAGSGSDVVNITTGTLIWNGLARISTANSGTVTTYHNTPAGPVIAGGPGTGSGAINIVANEIVFGYGPMDQPQNLASLDRLVLGFSNVNLTASEEITGNSKGSLSVYLAETGPGAYTGGNLNLITPLLTGAPGSVLSYKTGGTLTLTTPAGSVPATLMSDSLGAEINLSGNTIVDSTSIFAASGKVSLNATGNLSLNSGSRIDVSGLTVAMFDQSVPTFGGDVALESISGDITQFSSSVINVSATGVNAGSLTISATGTTGGIVSLGGTLLGSSTGNFNAGSFEIQAQNPGDFIALNLALDAGGFFYSRTFDIKQGNIDIPFGTTITAHTVGISVDNGSLTISGTINASGATPGTIRLSSIGNLELTSTGILDVHSTVLQVDSYGQPIDAENRGVVELTVADGTNTSVSTLNNGQGSLFLDPGSTINMSSPDGVDRGDLELNAPRTSVTSGNIRIEAAGPLNISGAQTIAVNAFWTYAPTDPNGTIVQSAGTGVPTGAVVLDQVNQDSLAFIKKALASGQLNSTLKGLTTYTQAFHLRPGVEIVSATPNGNLTLLGDLDLSKYRYASVNPNSPLDSTYGSGEPGVVVLRAGGNLNIDGSINDGFAPLSLNGATLPDENGWVLFGGVRTLSNVMIETTGVTLDAGTKFSNESVALAYAISIDSARLKSNVTIPVTVTLASRERVTTPFVATADITLPNGEVFHAGQTVPGGIFLPAGTTFASGCVLPFSIKIAAVTWPAGALLSDFAGPITLAANVTLQPGDLVPAGSTPTFASGIKSVDTRPVNNGIQGQVYAVEQMLSLGPNGQEPLSWSIRLVAGADTGAADTEAVQQQSALNGSGNLILDDPHYTLATKTPIFSVIRTGTGYLDLLAGGNFTEDSLYGTYTAGAQTTIPGANNGAFNLPRVGPNGSLFKKKYAVYETIATQDYQAYYPDNGGNVLVSARGTLTGFSIDSNPDNGNYIATYSIGDWLWRQGGTGIGQSTAWWINFGTYVPGANNPAPVVTGFTGIGALGGGNVTVLSGGDAGVTNSPNGTRSNSLFIAVGATGRVTSLNSSGSGSLVETGGGDAVIKIGGALNPAVASYGTVDNGFEGGEFVDLRGKTNISADSIGGIDLVYGQASNGDPRPASVSTAALFSFAFGGPVLAPGDATIDLQVNGDLILGNAADPGRVPEQNTTPVVRGAKNDQGQSWFSLWTPKTGVTVFSAGGNVLPLNTIASQVDGATEISQGANIFYQSYLFPANLSIIATNGSIYSGGESSTSGANITYFALELAPSPTGQLQMLAEESINANAFIASTGNAPQAVFFDISGAEAADLPNPFDAAYYVLNKQGNIVKKNGTNTSPSGSVQGAGAFNLFAFEPDSASGSLHVGDSSAAQIYAVNGDIVGLQVGEVRTVTDSLVPAQWFVAGKAMDIRAGV